MPQIAVITGASAGIGRAAAQAFARAGYSVAILARDPRRIESVCEQIRNSGGHALGISTDTPLEHFYREARAFRIYDGPSEVHRMVIARDVLRAGER